MGRKGAKATPEGERAAASLVDDLGEIGGVTSRRMFGGHGLFHDGVMFALVDSSGTAFLRADDETAPGFAHAGSEAHGRMPYGRIPPEVRDDRAVLLEWCRRAIAVARAAKN